MTNSGEYIPLDRAKGFVVDALMQFDPSLGKHAESVFARPERLNIQEIPEPKERMIQQCRPAKSKDNPNDYAIIDYEYDGSPLSVVYLAHELGHALADDLQRCNGRSYKDFNEGELEGQAYFVQQIVSTALAKNLGQTNILDRDLGRDVSVMSPHRAAWYTAARGVFDSALGVPQIDRGRVIQEALGQRNGNFNLVQ